jgi:hypothetical protein
MSALNKFSTTELHQMKAEIEEAIKERMQVPKKLENIDWSILMTYIENEMSKKKSANGVSKDFEHNLFEAAIETIYGKNIWEWWAK